MSEGPRYAWTADDRGRLLHNLTRVLAPHEDVVAAYLFGSALGDGPVGDVDVALLTRGDVAPSMALVGALGAAAATHLPPGLELDVRHVTPAVPTFSHEVLATGSLFYEADRGARVATEVAVQRRYLDERWLVDRYHALRQARVRSQGARPSSAGVGDAT